MTQGIGGGGRKRERERERPIYNLNYTVTSRMTAPVSGKSHCNVSVIVVE